MNELYNRLYRAIRKHGELTWREIVEASEHGADAGWAGFTYTRDCVDFYEANEADIWALANEQAEAGGYDNPAAMFATFGRKDMLSDPDTFKNLLAWFALEEVGNWISCTREAS